MRWDGLDAYGRPVNGSVKAKLSIQFAYPNGYAVSGAGGGGGGGSFGSPPRAGTIAYEGRFEAALQKVWEGPLGSWDNRAVTGLGGWSVSAHHVYDPTSGTLLLGSGERRAAVTLGNVMMSKPVIAGTRITVESILERLGAGESLESLLDAHPHLTKDAIHAARRFAAKALRAGGDTAHPP